MVAYGCLWCLFCRSFCLHLHNQVPYPSQRSIIEGAQENTFQETSETDTTKILSNHAKPPILLMFIPFSGGSVCNISQQIWSLLGLGTTTGSKLIYHDLQLHFIHLEWDETDVRPCTLQSSSSTERLPLQIHNMKPWDQSIHPAVNYASSSCVLYIYIYEYSQKLQHVGKQNSPLCIDTNRSGKNRH